MNNVSFIYHVNLNHLSLTSEQRDDYVSHFDYLLNKIDFPITISMFAEDLLYLSIKNSRALKELKENSNIRLFIPQYTHMLPYMFPHFLELQINLGKKVYDIVGIKNKMNRIFYSSEVDYLPPSIWPNLRNYCESIVVGETRIKIDGIYENNYPSAFATKFDERPIYICLSRRKFKYRGQLHRFLRDEISSGEMTDSLLSDIHNYGKTLPLIARIDLEVLVLNTINGTRFTLENKIDKWANFMNSLEKKGIRPIFIEEIDFKNLPALSEKLLSRNTGEEYRWKNDKLVKTIRTYDYYQLSSAQKAIYLSLLCSDYYCSNLKDFVFNTASGKLTICKTRKYRDLEISMKMFALQNKPVLPKDKYLQEYMTTFLKVVERVKVLL